MATSSSSSANKVAKLAQRGKGKKVRFQGGTLFPAAVLAVIIIGLFTIVYARQSRPDPGSAPPQVGDHWHAAYGMFVCDTWLPKLKGNKEETTTDPSTGAETYVSEEFKLTGIHSHDDGVIHYHPFSSASVGDRARLGVFLDVYNVELTDKVLRLPADQGGDVYEADKFKCDGKDVEIKVIVWKSYSDTGQGQTYITDLADTRITNDGMVFAIAVVPKGTVVTMPPWAQDLPALGAADTNNVPPAATATTTATSATTAPSATTEATSAVSTTAAVSTTVP